VLRWSALGLGVFYGIYHQRTIYSSDRAAAEAAADARKEKLIQQAKAEWAKKTKPEEMHAVSGGCTLHSLLSFKDLDGGGILVKRRRRRNLGGMDWLEAEGKGARQ